MIEFIDASLQTVASLLIFILTAPLMMAAIRLLSGPGYADRFVAFDMLTGIAIGIAALTMVATGRSEFLDIAFGIALIGFLATCSLSLLLERKAREEQA